LRQAITPEDLLNQWKLTRVAYLSRLRTATGTERNVLEVMDFQLLKCIEDLEKTINGEYPMTDFLRMMK